MYLLLVFYTSNIPIRVLLLSFISSKYYIFLSILGNCISCKTKLFCKSRVEPSIYKSRPVRSTIHYHLSYVPNPLSLFCIFVECLQVIVKSLSVKSSEKLLLYCQMTEKQVKSNELLKMTATQVKMQFARSLDLSSSHHSLRSWRLSQIKLDSFLFGVAYESLLCCYMTLVVVL